ncbi:MAG: hypothetical protein ACOCRO_07575 [Halanaerobiales bacterium]
MNKRFNKIGFSRHLRFEWLEYTINLILAGNTSDDINVSLDEFLKDKLAAGSNAKGNAREKTINILKKIWLNVPKELEEFRDEGLKIYKYISSDQHLVIHYGMAMSVYPFLRVVAESTGRLLRLQGNATWSQIERRVKEIYGDSATVSRSARYVLRSFVHWGILKHGKQKGLYEPNNKLFITNKDVIVWIFEAMLQSQLNTKISYKEIIDSPALFSFHFERIPNDYFLKHKRIGMMSNGIDNEVLLFKYI